MPITRYTRPSTNRRPFGRRRFVRACNFMRRQRSYANVRGEMRGERSIFSGVSVHGETRVASGVIRKRYPRVSENDGLFWQKQRNRLQDAPAVSARPNPRAVLLPKTWPCSTLRPSLVPGSSAGGVADRLLLPPPPLRVGHNQGVRVPYGLEQRRKGGGIS